MLHPDDGIGGYPGSADFFEASEQFIDGLNGEKRMSDQDPTRVQTILFDPKMFPPDKARKWLSEHDFAVTKEPDITEGSIRFRQKPPGAFQEGSFRTITLRPGIKAVIGRPKRDTSKPKRADRLTENSTMKLTIDGITVEIEDQAAQVVTKAIADRDAKIEDAADALKKSDAAAGELKSQIEKEKARADKAEEDRDSEKARADAAEDPKVVRERIDARLKLERQAAPILGEDQKLDGMSDDEIRAAVVVKTAKDPDAIKAKLDGADPAYVAARFDAAVDGYSTKEPARGSKYAAVIQDSRQGTGERTSEAARQQMIRDGYDAGRKPLN